MQGALLILNHLLEQVHYHTDRVCNAFELIGSTFLLDMQGGTGAFPRMGEIISCKMNEVMSSLCCELTVVCLFEARVRGQFARTQPRPSRKHRAENKTRHFR
jgi:hypothetical protein